MRGLKDRSVIVTGGANGIGAAIARRLAEEGCAVGILDLDAAAGEKVAAEIRGKGGKASLHALDISDYDAVTRAVEAFEAASGPVSFLVNNAGWDRAANFLDTDAGVLAQDRRHQSLRPAEREPRRAAGHGGARLRPGGQHRLRRRPRRLVGRGGLFGLQGRHDRVHQDDGARTGRQGHHRQHALPGPDRHRDPAQLPRRPGRRQASPRASSAPSRCAGSARRRTIPDWSRSSSPTTPPTSPARPSASRAASPCTDDRTMSEYKDILFEVRDGVAHITINRPEKYNAFTAETCEELIDAFQRAGWDKSVAVIVLGRRRRPAFCTGADQSAHEGSLRRPRHHRPADRRVAVAHSRRAEAGDRARAGLRHRRRQRAGDLVRPHHRVGEGGVRPGRPEGRLGRSGLRHRLSGAARRREARAGDLVPVPPLQRQGGATTWAWSTRWCRHDKLDEEVDKWCAEIRERSPTAIAIAKRSFNADSEHLRAAERARLRGAWRCSTAPRNRRRAAAPSAKSARRSSGDG